MQAPITFVFLFLFSFSALAGYSCDRHLLGDRYYLEHLENIPRNKLLGVERLSHAGGGVLKLRMSSGTDLVLRAGRSFGPVINTRLDSLNASFFNLFDQVIAAPVRQIANPTELQRVLGNDAYALIVGRFESFARELTYPVNLTFFFDLPIGVDVLNRFAEKSALHGKFERQLKEVLFQLAITKNYSEGTILQKALLFEEFVPKAHIYWDSLSPAMKQSVVGDFERLSGRSLSVESFRSFLGARQSFEGLSMSLASDYYLSALNYLPAKLKQKLVDMYALAKVLGVADFHHQNWLSNGEVVVGIDLGYTRNLPFSSVTTNPFDPRSYRLSYALDVNLKQRVSPELLAQLKTLSRQNLQALKTSTGLKYEDAELDGILARRDALLSKN